MKEREAWKRFVCRTRNEWNGPTNNSTICSCHFTAESFVNKMQVDMGLAKILFLKKDAIPSVYPEETYYSQAAGGLATPTPQPSSAMRKRKVLQKYMVNGSSNHDRMSNLAQAEPPQIKEEPEELCIKQEEEQLVYNQETNVKVEIDSKCEEICKLYKNSKYECKELLDNQHHPRNIIRIPGEKGIDPLEKHIHEEETDDKQLLWKQERSSSPEEEKPELPQIKEEWEKVCISEEEELLELKEDTDAFKVTEYDQESLDVKPEPSESPVLEANRQISNSDAMTVQLDPPSHEILHSCETCGKHFIQRGHLTIHIRTHTGERPFTCEICEKSFITNGNLKAHMKTHTGEKPFNCKVCPKRFLTSSEMKIHFRTHTGEKPFLCKVCARSFTTSSALTVHMRTHSGERPFLCEVCEKGFLTSSEVKIHMRTHTGERPFSCIVCGQSFIRSSHLKAHMRTHTGEKPFSCSLCNKHFSRSSSLKIRTMTHAGEASF